MALLDSWVRFAVAETGPRADAMCLSTLDDLQQPDSRMVLAERITSAGIAFYTDAQSPKAVQLREHPASAGLFYWPEIGRQVRLRGTVQPLPEHLATANFAAKSRQEQIAIAICQQSAPLASFQGLVRRFDSKSQSFPTDTAVERPASWQGFLLLPSHVEFFQAKPGRLNRRFAMRMDADGRWRGRALEP